jgi:hypothetical protein
LPPYDAASVRFRILVFGCNNRLVAIETPEEAIPVSDKSRRGRFVIPFPFISTESAFGFARDISASDYYAGIAILPNALFNAAVVT